MILIDISAILTAIIGCIASAWNWLDTVVIVPEFGGGISLLEIFVGAFCVTALTWFAFGFKGDDE